MYPVVKRGSGAQPHRVERRDDGVWLIEETPRSRAETFVVDGNKHTDAAILTAHRLLRKTAEVFYGIQDAGGIQFDFGGE